MFRRGRDWHPFWILQEREPIPCDDEFAYAEWMAAADESGARQVARTELEEGWISTVFLGRNHNYQEGPPLVFETMVFMDDSSNPMDLSGCRYYTWAEAELGHAEIVRRVKLELLLQSVHE